MENINDLIDRHQKQGSVEIEHDFEPLQIYQSDEYSRIESVLLHIPRQQEVIVKNAADVMFKQVPNYIKLLEEIDQYRTLLRSLDIKVYDDVDFKDTDLNPFPNQIYMRDLAVITPDHLIVANPKYKIRQGEQYNMLTTLRRHGYVGRIVELPNDVHMEGADFFWVSKDEVIISVGNRTSSQFADMFKSLYPSINVRTVEAAPEGIPQHILGGAHIIDSDTIIQRKAIIKHDLGFKNVISLDETDEAKNRYAMNIVTVGPMEIIMPSGNPNTKSLYESYGVKVHESPAFEIGKMGGAFACQTLILKRKQND